MANNIYGELFEQLPIPERLSPDNIAKMLDEQMAANGNRKKIAVTSSSVSVSQNKPNRSAAYRAIMSVAACAVLVLGLIRYTSEDRTVTLPNEPSSGNYAQDYDEIHKTFQKFYVDDEDKTTLDSAIAEIENSYNNTENNSQTDEVKEPAVTVGTSDQQVTLPEENEDIPPVTETPDIEEVPDEEEEIVEDIPEAPVDLPNIDGFSQDHGIITEGGRIFLRDGNDVLVFSGDSFRHEAVITPIEAYGEHKELADIFVSGDRITVVYNVATSQTVEPSEAEKTPTGDTLGDLLDEGNIEEQETVTRYSVEVKIFSLTDIGAFEVYSQSQVGSYISAVEADGSVYVVTDYNDYRVAPIVGVDDLESYVPTYSVMGERKYIEANSILLPSKITTTDYTVISGINTQTLQGNIQALLGYEGRVVATSEAVYIFGYETDLAVGGTGVEIFALSDGIASHRGHTVIEGLALSGDGIALCDDTILVSTVCGAESSCTTTVRAYDTSLEIISKVDFPGLFTNIHRDGSKLYLGNDTASYGVDFADPTAPELIEVTGVKDVTDSLVKFEDGYLALVERNGELVLSKLIEDADGDLSVCAEAVIYSGTFTSKALENNDIMYASGNLVGVPYGYYDGLDYCYTYALYKSTATGFELVGSFEAHETDTAFELGKSVEMDGRVYLFSEGRVYKLTANEDALAVESKIDLIYSTYSGHNGF